MNPTITTTISGLDHPANDVPKSCTELRQLLPAGGSVKKQTIALQGEHAQKVNGFLNSKNIKFKFAKD